MAKAKESNPAEALRPERWSLKQKTKIILRLLRGEDLGDPTEKELKGPPCRAAVAASGGALRSRIRRRLGRQADESGTGHAWIAGVLSVALLAIPLLSQPEAREWDPETEVVAQDDLVGRVLASTGRPIEGATVTVFPNSTARDWPPIKTDIDGVFRMRGFGDTWYTYLQIEAPGFGAHWITDLQIGEFVEFVINDATQLCGAFLSPEGQPAGSTTVTLNRGKASTRSQLSLGVGIRIDFPTDTNGEFCLPLEAGTYDVQIESESGLFARYPKLDVEHGRVTVLPPKLSSGVRFVVQVIDSITGEPVEGARLWVEERFSGYISPREGSHRTTDEHGYADWESLVPGKSRFAVHKTGYSRWWSVDPTSTVSESRQREMGPQSIQALSFDLRHDMPLAIIKMEKGVKISGRVLSPDGKPVPDAHVHLSGYGTGDARFMMVTDEDGRFGPRGDLTRKGYVPASHGRTYRLCAADTQGRWRGDLAVTPRRWANAVSEPFQPQPGDELEFTLQMTPGGWLVGRVVDPEGMPVVGVEVVAVASDGFDKLYVYPRTITGADGRYRLGPMRSGEHLIVADASEGPNFFSTLNDRPLEGRTVSVADGDVLSAGDLTFIAPPDWKAFQGKGAGSGNPAEKK